MNSVPLTVELPVLSPSISSTQRSAEVAVALVGNPNSGKTSLFNRLTGLRSKTANFAGTTVEHRRGQLDVDDRRLAIVDLPGLYSLVAVTEDEKVAVRVLTEDSPATPRPELIILVLDATNLQRGLLLASQVLELGRPTIAAVNLIDAAIGSGLGIDFEELRRQLGCPVLPVSARTGQGLAELRSEIAAAVEHMRPPQLHEDLAACGNCRGCQISARFDWAEGVQRAAVRGDASTPTPLGQALDRLFTHTVGGVASFFAVMALVFVVVFWFAQYPMSWIENFVALAGDAVGRLLPAGDLSSLVTDGLIAGIGSVIVFLPQICLLFFVLALLEDTGYMARAALVMDRLMHRVGLPGKAFVPMLSAHACAIPAIMSTRIIEDRRDRLATIMVIPLLTCSARVPVYVMVMALLFPHEPLKASLLFAGAYALGIGAALAMAWVFRHTLLKGPTRPLVIELPNYRLPSLRNALLLTYDRAMAFVKTAGTTILVISLALWVAATYPKTAEEQLPAETQSRLTQLRDDGDNAAAEHLLAQAQLERSFAGRLGSTIEPVFAPLGFDWKMSVGVLSSFAAREVIVSTLGILYGLGADAADETPDSLIDSIRSSTRSDGSLVFTTATCLSVLVFYVLAMQCLPTQAVARRETGSWKWPLVQLGYMTVLAYTSAFATYQIAAAAGL